MKKIFSKSLIILSLCVFGSTLSLANELKVINKDVLPGDTLHLIYVDNDSLFKSSDSVYAFIYSFSQPNDIPAGYNGLFRRVEATDTLVCNFLIPDKSVYGLIKIGDGFTFDTNYGKLWEYFVINPDSTAKRNAHYFAALSYLASNPDNFKRIPDFALALDEYQAENMLYPDNLLSTIAELSLHYELMNISEKEYNEQLERIIASARFDWDNESEIDLIIKSLRILGKTDKSKSLRIKYAKHYPDSKIAEEIEFEKLSKIDDFNDFIDKSIIFIKRHPNSAFNEKLYLAIIKSYLQTRNFDKMINLFNNMDVPSDIFYQIALNLLENKELNVKIDEKKRFDIAKNLLNTAISKIENEKYPNLTLTPIEKRNLKNRKYLNYYFQLAKLYWDENKPDSLEQVFGKILLIDKRFYTQEQLYKMTLYSYKFGRYELSLKLSEMYLIIDNKDVKINNINKNSFIKYNSIEDYNSYIKRINNLSRQKTIDNVRDLMIEKFIDLPTIKTLDRTTVSLKMFKGRILVIYSFGYFCEECWDIFADIEKLNKDYSDKTDVMIFPVLLWEKDKKKLKEVQKFIEKNNLNVSIYYDYINSVYKNLSITGVPNISIIGQEGAMNFRIDGIEPGTDIYEQIKTYIEYLKNQ
jgi:peroxiredoxin